VLGSPDGPGGPLAARSSSTGGRGSLSFERSLRGHTIPTAAVVESWPARRARSGARGAAKPAAASAGEQE